LGVWPDCKLAAHIGCPAHVVTFKRKSLNIPPSPESGRKSWTRAEIQLLGTVPDEAVARQTGRSVIAVTERRQRHHIPKPNPELRHWTAAEEDLLGTASDAEIARRLGRTLSGTVHRRVRLRIPAWQPH
jgi:hypothetical protein